MPKWKKLAIGGASAALIAGAMAGTYEGIRYHVYGDVGGVPTVCEGVTQASLPPGVKIDPNHVYTPAECVKLDSYAEHKAQAIVERTVHVALTQDQEAALTDFVYNEGEQHWLESEALREFNRGNIRAGCNGLLPTPSQPKRWVSAGGKILRGLLLRRQAEWQLCTGQF